VPRRTATTYPENRPKKLSESRWVTVRTFHRQNKTKLERAKLANTPRQDTDAASDGHDSREEDDRRERIEEERRAKEVGVSAGDQLEGSVEQRSICQPVKDEAGSCSGAAEEHGDGLHHELCGGKTPVGANDTVS
jgi:hypothetical protein